MLILGPIHMDDLGKLKGIGGLGPLGDLSVNIDSKDKDKEKAKDKKGGSQ